MFALTRALQHELGITSLSDTFGPTTESRFTSQIGAITSATKARVVQILACALWCKGYFGGDILSGRYTEDIAASCSSVKRDMGLSDTSPDITVKIMKSILTMDAYVLVRGGDPTIRSAQRWLNATYLSRRDFAVVPADGIFSRDVQKGLMFAIQYEIGMADGTANGSFGPGTVAGLKEKGTVSLGMVDGTRRWVRLFQSALAFNRRPVPVDGSFGTSTKVAVQEFQEFVRLPSTGIGNFSTWASLLVSTGDPDRPGTACDTNVPITATTAAVLTGAGYSVVGRYLNGVTKRIQAVEIRTIHDAGMSLFPIFQEYNNAPGYFTGDIGYRHGSAAVLRARQLGIKPGAVIYFPVDWDATDGDIEALVIPWFEKVRDGVRRARANEYQIGVYGPRNVCQKVCDRGLAVSAFVGGISRGWSGNLGYPLPGAWAYDQIQELKVSTPTGLVEIDKVIVSPRAAPIGPDAVLPTPSRTVTDASGTRVEVNDWFWRLSELTYQAECALERSVGAFAVRKYATELVLYHLQKRKYDDMQFRAYTPQPESVMTDPVQAALLSAARQSFHDSAALVPVEDPLYDVANYAGDLEHFAASTRGYVQWSYTSDGSVGPGDLGAWALDLVTFWAEYATARSADSSLTVGSWCGYRLGYGAAGESSFGETDLIADIDAFLVAKRLLDDADRSLADAVREILTHDDDPRWRYRTFLRERFADDRTRIEAAVHHLFVNRTPWVFPAVSAKLDGARRPGEQADDGSVTEVELVTELPTLARVFADRLLGAPRPPLP
ncbi:glycoside hydrolase domain-containing protein [Cellulomonas terrae]|nr:glycoside hydrolase domain-containing protein [Cellulomonas terrae]